MIQVNWQPKGEDLHKFVVATDLQADVENLCIELNIQSYWLSRPDTLKDILIIKACSMITKKGIELFHFPLITLRRK